MTLADRVKKAREHARITQGQLVERIQKMFGVTVTQQAISYVERGGVTEHIVKIAVACGVSPVWLDSGKGPMEVPSDKAVTIHQTGPDPTHLADVIEIIEKRFPPEKVKLAPADRARMIAQAYDFLKPDGSIDVSKVLDVVVNPAKVKPRKQEGGRERGKRRKGGAG